MAETEEDVKGEKSDEAEKSDKYQPPKGVEKTFESSALGLKYDVKADWIVVRKKNKPVGEMFFTYYKKSGDEKRPVTFLFNGGPGASSAYLHIGAAGPRRVAFNTDGTQLRPPARLEDNSETWLSFTDMVFVDPVGTGFSQVVEEKDDSEEKPKPEEKENFWQVNRDLESICEFVRDFLSKNKRWSSPVFIAGESYGGFRVAKLVKLLQESYGVGLNGAMLISPAFSLHDLDADDYDFEKWLDGFPSQVIAACHHRRGIWKDGGDIAEAESRAEKFLVEKLMPLLSGLSTNEEDYTEMAGLMGLSIEYVKKKHARISYADFARELLKDEGKVCGMYDASIVATNPFADRDDFSYPDPTLSSIERSFTTGINTLLHEELELETDRAYCLLSEEANEKWINDNEKHLFMPDEHAGDDFRYGIALNEDMKVAVIHGNLDLITPYHASKRLLKKMRFLPHQLDNLSVETYGGGHMFYTWEKSRKDFTEFVSRFYQSALKD